MSMEQEERRVQRLIAMFALRQLCATGISFREAEEIIEDGHPDHQLQDALDALKERGELEHMMMWLWFPIRRQ